MEKFFRGGVFRYFWRKSTSRAAQARQPHKPVNVVECFLVGLQHGINGKLEPWQHDYSNENDDQDNLIHVPSVQQQLMVDGAPLMNGMQKPRLLMRKIIERHMFSLGGRPCQVGVARIGRTGRVYL